MADYATKTKTAVDNTQHLGSVTGQPVRQYVVNIEASVDRRAAGDAEEFIVKLNGYVMCRVNRHRAERLGLIAIDAQPAF